MSKNTSVAKKCFIIEERLWIKIYTSCCCVFPWNKYEEWMGENMLQKLQE